MNVTMRVLDIYTNHTYFVTSGKNLTATIQATVVQERMNQVSNLTFWTTGSALSGPPNSPVLGFPISNLTGFAISLPDSFDVDLDQASSASSGQLVNQSLTILQGSAVLINGTTQAGITLSVSGMTHYDEYVVTLASPGLLINDFSQFMYLPLNFPSFESRSMIIGSPLGRMNISSGSTTLLGVETVKINGTIAELDVSNDSGRIRMAFTGSANFIMVNGVDITKKSLTAFLSANLAYLSIILTIIGLVPVYITLYMQRRKSKRSSQR
jgi:hypothetical protein